jgi:hypothetical protein
LAIQDAFDDIWCEEPILKDSIHVALIAAPFDGGAERSRPGYRFVVANGPPILG